jgi:hypothetical protein
MVLVIDSAPLSGDRDKTLGACWNEKIFLHTRGYIRLFDIGAGSRLIVAHWLQILGNHQSPMPDGSNVGSGGIAIHEHLGPA